MVGDSTAPFGVVEIFLMKPLTKPWEFEDHQGVEVHGRCYNVHAAISLSKDLEVVEIPIKYMHRAAPAPCENKLMDFIRHVKAVNEADLSYPIIMNEWGVIIDGKHRLAKAILEGHKTIKCKKFETDPEAIYTVVDD